MWVLGKFMSQFPVKVTGWKIAGVFTIHWGRISCGRFSESNFVQTEFEIPRSSKRIAN